MDKIEYPWHEDYWCLYITHTRSTTEIWGKLIGKQHSVSFIACLKVFLKGESLSILLLFINVSFRIDTTQKHTTHHTSL